MITIKNIGTAEQDSAVSIIVKAVSANATQEIHENVIRRKKEPLWKD